VAPKRGSPAKGKPVKGKSPAKKAKVAVAVESEDDEESEAEYEVERIVDLNQKKGGKREFLVHWKGFSSREDTWEPEDNLNCKDLIKKYLEQLKVGKNASPKVAKATKRVSAPKDGRRASRRNDSKER
jgi:Chromo (CHRromatin Organisation MOdifier) domain